jgi:hypothetical protein
MSLSVLLGGCAVCGNETFYKAGFAGEGVKGGDLLGREAQFFVGEGVHIRVAILSNLRNTPDTGPAGVWITIRVAEGTTVRLPDPSVAILDTAGTVRATWPIPKLAYGTFCAVRDNAPVKCTGSDEPSVLGPVVKSGGPGEGETGPRASYYSTYVFDPSLTFKGAKDSYAPPMARLFTNYENWRPYTARTARHDAIPLSEFIVAMPAIEIDGKRVEVPKVRFKWTQEEVCHDSPH